MIIENVRFIVNGNVVICKLLCDPDFEVDLYNNIPQEIYEYFEVTGRATCNESDTFDLETGKRIAETKARIKAHSKMQKMYSKVYNQAVMPIIKNLNSKLFHDEAKICTQIHRYEKLTGEPYQRWEDSE